MISDAVRGFSDAVCEAGRMEGADVRRLADALLGDGLASREEADVIIALDRTVACADEACAEAWGELYLALLVDWAVWSRRSTGVVDMATARWLVTAIHSCGGPTENAKAAVAAIVREAQRVDEALLDFVMRRGVLSMRDVVASDGAPARKRVRRAA